MRIGTKIVAAGYNVATNESMITFVKPSEPNTIYNMSGASVSTLLNYLYGKMGYKVLSGEDYTYAKAATRLDLAKEGLGQVSVKIAETAKE